MLDRKLVPFVDMAYQGSSRGADADGAVVRRFVETGVNVFVSVSFSLNFSLYGERVGALGLLCGAAEEARRVLSRVKVVVRTNDSNPPTHGDRVVTAVLSDPQLRELWETELGGCGTGSGGCVRPRIRKMRQALADRLARAGVSEDMSFTTRQAGMFSYSGLSPTRWCGCGRSSPCVRHRPGPNLHRRRQAGRSSTSHYTRSVSAIRGP